MSLANIVTSFYGTYNIKKYDEGAGQYVNGVYQKPYQAITQLEAAIFPIGQADLEAAEPGTFSSQDIKIYRAGGIDIPEKSRIEYKNKWYEIRASVSREDNGDFSSYLARKLDD